MAENELSGSVHGPAVQAGTVTGGINFYGQLSGQPGLVSVAVPERRVEHEVHGRSEMLNDLRSRTGLVVLCGAGGFGKTTVALALAREMKADRPVWWVDASTAEGVVAGLREVALSAGAQREEVAAAWRGEMSAPDLLWRSLEGLSKQWLLVVDNADEPVFVTDWIRNPQGGLVVVTSRESRNSVWGRRTPVLPVTTLSDVDGGAVLRELAPLAGNVADAERLSERLGGVPLALWVTGRLLEQASSTPSVPGLDEPRTFAALQDQIGTVRSGDEIGQTWELSLDSLARRGNSLVRPLFRLLSFFGPMSVPTCLLNAKVMTSFDVFAGVQPVDVAQTLGELMSAGLIDRSEMTADAVTLHPLIRETSNHQADARRDAAQYEGLCMALLSAEIERLQGAEARVLPTSILLVMHGNYFLENLSEEDYRRLVYDEPALGEHMASLANSMVAVIPVMFRKALANSLKLLGPDWPEQLTTWTWSVAPVLEKDVAETEARYREELAVQTRELGIEHSTTLITRDNLAQLLMTRGQLAEAETEFRTLLELADNIPGAAEMFMVSPRHNIAQIAWMRGDLGAAEAEFRDVLAKEAQVLQIEHPHLLAIRHRIACLVWMQGDAARAEVEFREVLDARLRSLSAGHPGILRARHFVAFAVWSQGRVAEAEIEYWGLLADCESELGPEHKTTEAVAEGLVELCEGSVPRRWCSAANVYIRSF